MLRNFIDELHRRDALLAYFGWLQFALLAVFLTLSLTDARELLGQRLWLKPAKFAASIGIFVWTVGWLLGELQVPRWALSLISKGTAITMLTEIVLIALQAARGMSSHFNNRTLVDSAIFGIMGIMAVSSALLLALMLVLHFITPPDLPAIYLWAVRIGIVLFLFGGYVGGKMGSNLAHTVGGVDGGPGLPLLGWSTVLGDLRVSHALALHALQLLPLAAWLTLRLGMPPATGVAAFSVVAGVYATLTFGTYVGATRGRPLLPASNAMTMASVSPAPRGMSVTQELALSTVHQESGRPWHR